MRKETRQAYITLAALFALACSKQTAHQEDAGPLAVSQPAPSASVAVGLDAPTNSAEVVALARRALPCWEVEDTLLNPCAAVEQWKEAKVVQASSADPTLLSMLGDPRDAVRWLAAIGLSRPRDMHRDANSAKILIDAARREKNEKVGGRLGAAIGEIHVNATHLDEPMRELSAKHPLASLRRELVRFTLAHNPTLYEHVATLARTEQDVSVRLAAIDGIALGQKGNQIEMTSALWVELTADEDPDIATKAARNCATYAHLCAAAWDGLLTRLEARSQAFTSFMPEALTVLHPKATAAQKARAEKLASAVAESPKNPDLARSFALRGLAKMNAASARTLALKLKDDPSPLLRSHASAILDRANLNDAGTEAGRDANSRRAAD